MVHKYNPLSIAFPCGQRPEGSCLSVSSVGKKLASVKFIRQQNLDRSHCFLLSHGVFLGLTQRPQSTQKHAS